MKSICFRCLDAAAERSGATRGEGEGVKTTVRLVGHPAAVDTVGDEWVTDRVRGTCCIEAPNGSLDVLGSLVGPPAAQVAQSEACLGKLKTLHAALGGIGDPKH